MRIASCLLCLVSFSATVAGHDLVWEVVEDFSGDVAIARAITLSENAAIFIGNVGNTANHVNEFVVQSLRRSNGSVQWTDRTPTPPGMVVGLQIASSRGRVFASGYVAGETPSSGTAIAVRGYETLTGTLLWSDVWDAGGADDLPNALAAGPAAVVVVGYGGYGSSPGSDDPPLFLVRAYNPISGAVLWEDRVERSEFATIADTVALTQNRVFVAGRILHDSAPSDLLVRAYNALDGALVWETTRPSTTALAIEAGAGRVFLAGSQSAGHSYVGAFDARNGALLWEENDQAPGMFQDIAVDGHRVAAAGRDLGSGLLVRVYDASSGIIEWQDQTFPAQDHYDFALGVALNERAVYVAGSSGQYSVESEFSEILVRRYDAVTGTLSWDDRSHSALEASAVDLALGKNGLFVAGYERLSPSTSNIVIRAYGVRNDGTVPQLERVSR